MTSAAKRSLSAEERNDLLAHDALEGGAGRIGDFASGHGQMHHCNFDGLVARWNLLQTVEGCLEHISNVHELADAIGIDFWSGEWLQYFFFHDCPSALMRLRCHQTTRWNASKNYLQDLRWNRFRVASEQFEASALSRRGPDFRLTHSEQFFSEFRSSFPRTTPGAVKLARASARVLSIPSSRGGMRISAHLPMPSGEASVGRYDPVKREAIRATSESDPRETFQEVEA